MERRERIKKEHDKRLRLNKFADDRMFWNIISMAKERAENEDEAGEVRACEERSDELRRRVYRTAMSITDATLCNVAAG
jgi:hypothetical protein